MFLMIANCATRDCWRERLRAALAPLGTLEVVEVGNAMNQIKEADGLVIVDATFVDKVDAVVSNLRTERPDSRIVVMTASPTWQRARAAFEAGAIDYLPKTMEEGELVDTFRQILKKPLPPWPK